MSHKQERKLLLLGGSNNAIQIVNEAKRLGLKVGVIDYYDSSLCKSLADYEYCHNVFDTDFVADLLKSENYSGLLTGYSELLLNPYAEVSEKSNLKCYGSSELFKISTDKKKFKDLCKKYDVPIMPEYSLSDAVADSGIFPLVVKPVDSAASVGVAICTDYDELSKNYDDALSVSKSKKVLIEKCASGREATFFYYFNDGEVYLTAFADRLLIQRQKNKPPMPVGYVFPGDINKTHIDQFNNKLLNLFHKEGFKNGMAFAQTFVEKDGIYLCEIGYRLTPSFETFIIQKLNCFNPIEAMIKYAINEKIDDKALQRIDPFKGYAANVTILVNPGRIMRYEGLDKIRQFDFVIKVLEAWEPGHVIKDSDIGTLAQVGLRILLTADSKQDLLDRMDLVKDMIMITDDTGTNLAIKDYSYNTLAYKEK